VTREHDVTVEQLWTCPRCGRRFTLPNLWHSCVRTTVDEHLSRVPEAVSHLYRGIEAMVRACGPVEVVPVASYISFMVRIRFAFAIPQQRALRLSASRGPGRSIPHGS
jgi:hypothetical protein